MAFGAYWVASLVMQVRLWGSLVVLMVPCYVRWGRLVNVVVMALRMVTFM